MEPTERTCPQCGSIFTAARKDQKYCCKRCGDYASQGKQLTGKDTYRVGRRSYTPGALATQLARHGIGIGTRVTAPDGRQLVVVEYPGRKLDLAELPR